MSIPCQIIVTAEHTHGQSISHPCTRGVWEDPTESFWWTKRYDSLGAAVRDRENALREATDALTAEAESYDCCQCHRMLRPGNDRWHDSVVLHSRFSTIE